MIEPMLTRLLAGDTRALARAISLVENDAPEAGELLAACSVACTAAGRKCIVIGITGAPGAGKSTLVDQLVRLLRARKRTVGVVAVDPSSPITGGALLGDRIRMQGFAGDHGVYLRSMASRGVPGGVGRAATSVCMLLGAAGLDVAILETVGAGQDEVAVASIVDVTVLVLTAGMGDDVQSMKAGIMEVADIYVINRADTPGADRLEREIKAMQSLTCNASPLAPVLRTIANVGLGVPELLDEILTIAPAPVSLLSTARAESR